MALRTGPLAASGLLLVAVGCRAVDTRIGLAFDATGETASPARTNWILTVPTSPSHDHSSARQRLVSLQREYASSVPEAVLLQERVCSEEVAALLTRERELHNLLAGLEPSIEASGPLVESVGGRLRESFDDVQRDLRDARARHEVAREACLAMQDRQVAILALAVSIETDTGREGTATRMRAANLRLRALEARITRRLRELDEGTSPDVSELRARLEEDLALARASFESGMDAYCRGEVAGAEIELAAMRLSEEEARGGEVALEDALR